MPEEKTGAGSERAKTEKGESPFWTMPFPEMMAEWMTRCGCRVEPTGVAWAGCCGWSPEKKQDQNRA